MENAHYPWAHDNVERIKGEIQRQEQMALLQAENEGLKAEVQNRKDYSNYLMSQIGGGKQ